MASVNSKRLDLLDTLRGIAIIGVVLIHSKNFAVMGMTQFGVPEVEYLSSVSDFGMYGVELFFAISGYLISMLYPRSAVSLAPWSLKSYFARRFARIWPLWALFATLGFAVGISKFENDFYTPWDAVLADTSSPAALLHDPVIGLLLSLLFLGFLSPLLWGVVPGGWSIQNEIANYAIYAALRRRSLRVFIVVLFCLGVLQSCSYFITGDPYSPLEVFGRLNVFSSLCFSS